MRSSRPIWTTSLALLGLIGVVIAVLSSPSAALWSFGMPGAVIGVVAANVTVRGDSARLPIRARIWDGCRYGAVGGCYVVALVGLSEILPVWLLLLLVCASLALIGLDLFSTGRLAQARGVPALADWDGGAAWDGGDGVDASTLDVDERRLYHARTQAHGMSTPRLCEAWSASFAELERCADPASRAWAATHRQIYLDELERRDPEALHAWLDSGARAASNPRTFLRRHERGAR